MRAAVFHGRGDVRVQEVPDPFPGPGELLLEVTAAGVCGTDAHEYAHGPVLFPIAAPHPATGHVGPMIPGHEFAGRVVAVGRDVRGYAEGELVASGGGYSCGQCLHCASGRTNLCRRYAAVGLYRDGALARYCAVPAVACLSAEEAGLDGDTAALAQPMSIAVHALRRGGARSDERVVVVGAGGIGAFLTFAAASHGAAVDVVEPAPDRRRLAAALGADRVVPPDSGAALREQLEYGDAAPRVVFEVSGADDGLREAAELLPAGGRIVQVSLLQQPAPVPPREIALRELEIVGTNSHVAADDLPEAVRLLALRDAPWSDVAPVAIALDELVPAGLEPLAAGRPERVKTLVDPQADATRPTAMSGAGPGRRPTH